MIYSCKTIEEINYINLNVYEIETPIEYMEYFTRRLSEQGEMLFHIKDRKYCVPSCFIDSNCNFCTEEELSDIISVSSLMRKEKLDRILK